MVAKGKRGEGQSERALDWEFGVSRYKLLRQMKNKVLLYSTGNYVQNPVTNYNGK